MSGCNRKQITRKLGRTQPWWAYVMKNGNVTERVLKQIAVAMQFDLKVSLLRRRDKDGYCVVASHIWKFDDPIDLSKQQRKK